MALRPVFGQWQVLGKHLLKPGETESRGCHDCRSPFRSHGHHSCLLESSSPGRGGRRLVLTMPPASRQDVREMCRPVMNGGSVPLVFLRQACSWLSGRPSCGKTPSLFLRKRRKLNFKKKERIQNNPQFLTDASLTVSSTTHTSALTAHPPHSTWPKMPAAATKPGNVLALRAVLPSPFSLACACQGFFLVDREPWSPQKGPGLPQSCTLAR